MNMAAGGSRKRVRAARGAANIVQIERSQRREGRPSLATSLSEKNPPATTPKDPPTQEAVSIQYPRLK